MDVDSLKRDIETGNSLVRETQTKFVVRGQHEDKEDLELLISRDRLKIKWSGYIERESEEVERCDLGHDHRALVDKHWVWEYCDLNKKDLTKLIKFLIKARNSIE